MVRATKWHNFLLYDQFKDATAEDSGFFLLCNPVCFSKSDKIGRQI